MARTSLQLRINIEPADYDRARSDFLSLALEYGAEDYDGEGVQPHKFEHYIAERDRIWSVLWACVDFETVEV